MPPLHGSPAGNAVVCAHAGVGGRVVLGVLTVSRVLGDDRAGPGQSPAAEGLRAAARPGYSRAVVDRKNQPSVIPKNRVADDLRYGCGGL